MHISPAWKHADTLEAFECREGEQRKKEMSRSKCFSNGYRFNSMVWREGWEIYFFFFLSSLFPFQNMKKKSKSVLLSCSALLFFNSLVWLWLSLSLPPPSVHPRPREDLAKTADNLAGIKHSWVPLKRNKLPSDFSTHKAK